MQQVMGYVVCFVMLADALDTMLLLLWDRRSSLLRLAMMVDERMGDHLVHIDQSVAYLERVAGSHVLPGTNM
ncbi:hypothetical protein Nepgr_022973 [Nepenthes gracilis]|uniref:Uncharacterized protein n=1 Tax=Nepenthes gracilis TaxID=150966 RepID=A0AAD3T1X4_NEPGR|nr:hypothetical protein Nepgr_022973 [Nepenthes gracilis]